MKLIRQLGTRLSKNGKSLQSWAEFECSYCFQIVERNLGNGIKAKSCGCYFYTKEFKQKMKGVHVPLFGENNPFYGKHHSKEAVERIRLGNKGDNNPMYGKKGNEHPKFGSITNEETKQKIGQANKGKKRTDEQRQIRSERQMGINNPNWNNGSSFEPYSPEFNKEKKQQILERDNFTCQDPNCKHSSDILDCHHIDYDKKNNTNENLVTLCRSCHAKTNGKNKRLYFTEYYQNMMISRIAECLL